jgi:hypothetical protein
MKAKHPTYSKAVQRLVLKYALPTSIVYGIVSLVLYRQLTTFDPNALVTITVLEALSPIALAVWIIVPRRMHRLRDRYRQAELDKKDPRDA